MLQFFAAFERHHIDRNFERTGQTTILVTPGSGVFEVDREMTSITKQRLLDSGWYYILLLFLLLISSLAFKEVKTVYYSVKCVDLLG